MKEFTVHRPDASALEALLERHLFDTVGTTLRLAWWAGLLRNEISALTWDHVNFLNQELVLADRSVPLSPALEDYLYRLSTSVSSSRLHVVLSDCRRRPMAPQPLSNLARAALDEAGQREVTLRDLRYDFIIRQLAAHDWQYVSRITGVEAATLNLHFAAYVPEKTFSFRIDAEKKPPQVDELRLRKLLQEEGASVVGLAIRLIWQAGLRVSEAVELTWGQVDTVRGVLHLPRREAALSPGLAAFLQPLKQGAEPGAFLLMTQRSNRPMRTDRLSRLTRAALIRAGLDNVSPLSLWCDHNHSSGEAGILERARREGSVTRQEIETLFHMTKSTAYESLAALTRRGELVRLGRRYYPAGTVISPGEQYDAVRAYLLEAGFAYRQDLARVLGLRPSQCSFVLKRLLAEGKLVREGQRYRLSESERAPEKALQKAP